MASSSDATFNVGQRVVIAGRLGIIRHAGATQFAAGYWVGVELDEAVGKNSGVVQGVTYFTCKPEHGIFVRPNLVTLEAAAAVTPRSSQPSPKMSARQLPARESATAAAVSGPSASAQSAPSLQIPQQRQVRRSVSGAGTQRPVAAAVALAPTAAQPPSQPVAPQVAQPPSQPTTAQTASAVPPALTPMRSGATGVSSENLGAPAPSMSAKSPSGDARMQAPVTSVGPQTAVLPPAATPKKNLQLEMLREKAEKMRKDVLRYKAEADKEKLALQSLDKRAEALAASGDTGAAQAKLQTQAERASLESGVKELESTIRALQQDLTDKRQKLSVPLPPAVEAPPPAPDPLEANTQSEFQQMQHQLEKARLVREENELELELARLELQELEEIEWSRSDAEQLGAPIDVKALAGACMDSKADPQVVEVRVAIANLVAVSMSDRDALRKRAEELEEQVDEGAILKRETESLTTQQVELQAQIRHLEAVALELGGLVNCGSQLQDAQAEVANELRRHLELCDGRVDGLEEAVKRLERERSEATARISADATTVKELDEKVRVAGGVGGDGLDAATTAAHLRRDLAELAAACETARAEAYRVCLPAAWGTGVAGGDQLPQLTKVYTYRQGAESVAKVTELVKEVQSGQLADAARAPPSTWDCCEEVRHAVEEVFGARQRTDETRARLDSQRKACAATEASLAQATARRAELEEQLELLKGRASRSNNGRREATALKERAAADVQLQAELEARLQRAQASRKDREQSSHEGEEELAGLERELQERKRKPGEADGRATEQELAALRKASAKCGRELYARRVADIEELQPLPAVRAHSEVDQCLARCAEARRSWLRECSSVRAVRLAPPAPTPEAHPSSSKDAIGENVAGHQLAQMLKLQLMFAEVRTLLDPLPAVIQDSPVRPKGTGEPLVQLKLDVPCPKWFVTSGASKVPMAVSSEELRNIHRTML